MGNTAWNPVVSMVKGVAIILMVTGHSLPVDNVVRNYIYMFHMPLFFFVSGYCFKEKYLDDWRTFVRRRVKGLWWPFVKYGVPMVLLHNVFCALHLYGPPCDVEPYTMTLTAKAVAMQFVMSGAEPLLGAYWFLNTLFGASLLFFVCRKVAGKWWTLFVLLVASAACLVLMPYMGALRIVFRMFFAGSYMALGHLMRTEKILSALPHGREPKDQSASILSLPWRWIGWILLAVFVGVGELFLPHEMTDATLPTMLPCMVVALAGILMLWEICRRLQDCISRLFTKIAKELDFIGRHTLTILTWHFLAFKAVTLLIIVLYGLPIEQLAAIPILEEQSAQGWWIVYIVAGVGGSCALLMKMKNERFTLRCEKAVSAARQWLRTKY